MFDLIKNNTRVFNKPIKGLTLAEILITMVIVAAIAMFLIPAIKEATPNNNKVMFKKAYSTLQNAVSTMINDDVNYPSTSVVGATTTQRGFNNTSKAGTTVPAGNDKFAYLLAELLNTVGAVTYPGNPPTPATAAAIGTFTTTDGAKWTIYIPKSNALTDTAAAVVNYPDAADYTKVQFPVSSVYYTTKVIVDVNGAKSPNCSADTWLNVTNFPNPPYTGNYYSATCTNPDTFIFGVRSDGKLQAGCSTVALNTLCTATTDPIAVDILQDPTSN